MKYLAVVFFLLAALSLSALPFAVRDGYKTWPVYALALILLGLGVLCGVLE